MKPSSPERESGEAPPVPTSPSGERLRHLKRVAKVLLSSLVAVWLLADVYARIRIDRVIRALESDGFAIDLAQMAVPEVPGDDSFARLMRAWATIVEPDKAYDMRKATLRRFRDEPPPEETFRPGQEEPTEDQVRRWLADNEAGLARMLEVVKGGVRMPRAWHLGVKLPMVGVAELRSAQECFCARAVIRATQGDSRGAISDMRAALEMLEPLRSDPINASQVIATAGTVHSMSALRDCLSVEPTPAQLRAWMEVVPPASHYDGIAEFALRSEIAVSAQTYSGSAAGVWKTVVLECSPAEYYFSPGSRLFLDPMLWIDCARYLETLQAAIQWSRQPYSRVAGPRLALLEQIAGTSRYTSPIRHCNLRPFGWPTIEILERHALVLAALEVTRAGLACELAYAEQGQYPAECPGTDPFTGGALVYSPHRDVLSSVGPDGIDDSTRSRADRSLRDDTTWHFLHPPSPTTPR